MIAEKHIVKLAEEGLSGSDNFLVEALVKPGNRIKVFIDSDSEVSVEACISLSRFIESSLDRDAEDFELMVSSAGLDQAFRQLRQYNKYIKRKVEIALHEGEKFTALLLAVDDKEITIRKLIKKQKNKAAVEGPEQRILLTDIKETKPAVQFS
jgi:ribosome maturation factor RimP